MVVESRNWVLSGFGDEIDPDPRMQVAVLQALGSTAIEVRSAWSTNVIDLSMGQLTELRSYFDSVGQTVSAIASPVGKVDVSLPVEHELERLGRAITAAQVLGTRYIRVFSFYRAADRSADEVRDAVLSRLSALTAAAERANVTLLHENEKNIYGDVPVRVLDLVESIASEHFRVVWDSANFVQCGVRPFAEGWPLLGPYVEYVHAKDAIATTGEVVVVGDGDGQVVETLSALRETGWQGYVSLEPHLGFAGAAGGFSGPLEFGRAARALVTQFNLVEGK